jgi:phytoene dehydrogenase-like protein
VLAVGAGFGGVCCAAEAVRKGASVALVAETPEVAWNIRTRTVAGNVGWMQHPSWGAAWWGGGWWYQLAGALDVSVEFEFTPPINVVLCAQDGSHTVTRLAFNTSARGVVDVLERLAPIPIDSFRDELLDTLRDALALRPEELSALADVPLSQWLQDRKASPELMGLFAAFAGLWMFSTPEEGMRDISVFGVISAIRIMQNAEMPVVTIVPDPWRGLALPIAAKVEELGGTIHRGRRVASIDVDNGQATGITFRDGQRVTAKHVAYAGGTRRLKSLLATPPPDVAAAIEYADQTDLREVDLFAVLGKPVITVNSYTMIIDSSFKFRAYISPLHALGPWSTQPGKQFIIVESVMQPDEYERLGREGALRNLAEVLEEVFPGYHDAVEATDVLVHRHLWQGSMTHGPKLPRTSPGVKGLWFVGDGSSPVLAIGLEYAAGAGILGAREILEHLPKA